jgi:5-methylcytosine-specific restriction endonuclease McrA
MLINADEDDIENLCYELFNSLSLESQNRIRKYLILEIDLENSRKIGSLGWKTSLQVDHVIPISKGGSDTLENVRPSHAICNMQKGVR